MSADGVGPECVSDMYQSKHQAEEAIRNSGIDYTIFKPSGMFKDFNFFHIPNVLKMGGNQHVAFRSHRVSHESFITH